jgi:hypothetical protein
MFVKDTRGYWYDVDEEFLKNKKIDPDKAREALIAERAEKRKKIIDLLSSLDRDDIEILHDKLIEFRPNIPDWSRPECIGRRPECISPRPDCIGINWGSSGGHPACDCKDGHPACDCSGAWERYYNWDWKVRR